MAINKVVYGNQTLIDLTLDDLTASDLALGKTAHDRSGNQIVGTATSISVYKTSTTSDGTTLIFSDCDLTKSYILIADYGNSYNAGGVRYSNFNITETDAVNHIGDITYTLVNGTANQSFDLVDLGL